MTQATTAPKTKKPSGAATRLLIRDLHLYFSVLAAPSLLFFAITGGIQLFGLHESHASSGYKPPAIIEKLGELHKNQVFGLKPRRAPPAAKPADKSEAAKLAAKPPAKKATPVAVTVLKWVSLAVVVSLVSSACLGLWMGLTQGRNRRLALILLVVGVILPVILAGLTA